MRRRARASARSRGQDGESCASHPGTGAEGRGVGNAGLSGLERRVLQELRLTNAARHRAGGAPSVSDSAAVPVADAPPPSGRRWCRCCGHAPRCVPRACERPAASRGLAGGFPPEPTGLLLAASGAAPCSPLCFLTVRV